MKINRKTGRSWWKNCSYWLILQKSWINQYFLWMFFLCIYFCKIWNLCIFGTYFLFLRMPYKKKISCIFEICVYSILRNWPKFEKIRKNMYTQKLVRLRWSKWFYVFLIALHHLYKKTSIYCIFFIFNFKSFNISPHFRQYQN